MRLLAFLFVFLPMGDLQAQGLPEACYFTQVEWAQETNQLVLLGPDLQSISMHRRHRYARVPANIRNPPTSAVIGIDCLASDDPSLSCASRAPPPLDTAALAAGDNGTLDRAPLLRAAFDQYDVYLDYPVSARFHFLALEHFLDGRRFILVDVEDVSFRDILEPCLRPREQKYDRQLVRLRVSPEGEMVDFFRITARPAGEPTEVSEPSSSFARPLSVGGSNQEADDEPGVRVLGRPSRAGVDWQRHDIPEGALSPAPSGSAEPPLPREPLNHLALIISQNMLEASQSVGLDWRAYTHASQNVDVFVSADNTAEIRDGCAPIIEDIRREYPKEYDAIGLLAHGSGWQFAEPAANTPSGCSADFLMLIQSINPPYGSLNRVTEFRRDIPIYLELLTGEEFGEPRAQTLIEHGDERYDNIVMRISNRYFEPDFREMDRLRDRVLGSSSPERFLDILVTHER
tara:strand:- start:18186 stop:19562 length:1377 start_codon:yes stop_codon:yes gene_type:complete